MGWAQTTAEHTEPLSQIVYDETEVMGFLIFFNKPAQQGAALRTLWQTLQGGHFVQWVPQTAPCAWLYLLLWNIYSEQSFKMLMSQIRLRKFAFSKGNKRAGSLEQPFSLPAREGLPDNFNKALTTRRHRCSGGKNLHPIQRKFRSHNCCIFTGSLGAWLVHGGHSVNTWWLIEFPSPQLKP